VFKVRDPTRVKSESRTFTIKPGAVRVPKYARPLAESITALPREASPVFNVRAPTRVRSESLTFTTIPGDVPVPK
jgi:hypothetical protein